MKEVREEFSFLFEDETPNIAVVAARGMGKTVAVMQLALHRLLTIPHSGIGAIFFSSTLAQAEDTFAEYINLFTQGCAKGFCTYNQTKHIYSFQIKKNDIRKLRLLSYETEPKALRGRHPHTIVLDECASMPANLYGNVIDPMLISSEDYKLIAIGTAEGHNQFYEFWKRGKDPDFENWKSYTLRASESKLLNPNRLWEARNNLTAAEYAQEFECDFDANVLVGAVYGEFMQRFTDNNVKEEYIWNPSLPVWTAWDLGYSDYTAVWFFQVKGDQVTFIDFFEDNGHETSYYADVLNKKPYNYAKAILPHDGGRSDMRGLPISEQLRSFGFRAEVLANTSELGGIDESRMLLKTARFSRNHECLLGLEHLKSFKWKMNKQTLRKLGTTLHDEHSHAADAFRYAAVSKDIWRNYGSGVRMVTAKRDYNVLY